MTETPKVETHTFETEARQLLDLMVHSIYSNKDIFLRELISNASDAIDKLRYESLIHTDLAKHVDDPHIRIEADKEARTISVIDTGIGMTHDEVVEYIGTIARSGSRDFAELIKQAKEQKDLPPELIGQFGVGF
ncbi:MAG: molecular chaperone HtpG, partial [Candidatus Sumerlaeota bacterium]